MTTPTSALDIPTRRALRRAFREAPELSKGLVVTVLLAMAGTALSVIVPVIVQQIIDSGIDTSEGVDTGGVLSRAMIALVAMLLAALAGRAALIRLARSSATGLSDLRVLTFRHIHQLSALHVQSERRGALVSRVTSDVDTMQHFMEWAGVGMIIGVAQLLLAGAVMVIYSWKLTIVVVIGVAAYGLMLAWFQRILARAHDQVRGRVATSLSAVGEAISGLLVIRAYGAEESTLARVDDALDRQFDDEYRTGKLGAVLFSSAELFAGALTAAVIIAGIWLGVENGITAGTLLAFLFLVNLLVQPVQLLVEALDTAQSAGAGLRRILAVLDSEVDVPDPEMPEALPAVGLDVTFSQVDFVYPGGEAALDGVSAHVGAGQRVAVVGATGSGKTTFAKLVTRLLDPTSGEVAIGGVAVDRVAFDELRSRVAFVPQEGFLFDADIRSNVRYGKPGASDDELVAAFVDLDLDRWLDGLPLGLDTEAGERGSSLSAGERQLVALVRAWIADPDLLVLDEATSAVDPALEVQIRRAIERLTAGRTSITIAHRLSTAEASDEVLVFENGKLVERGTHTQLLAAAGAYADLYADWERGTGT
jgi:putative ABC transport system ATP-binding protein